MVSLFYWFVSSFLEEKAKDVYVYQRNFLAWLV